MRMEHKPCSKMFTYKGLWKILIDRAMTKRELADLVGVKYDHIRKLGHAPENTVSTEVLLRICTVLGVDITEIIALEPNPDYDYHTLLENEE